MVKVIGTATAWTPIAKRSQNWGDRMNEHMLKLAVLTQGAVKSRTTAIPATGELGDAFINPSNNRIYVWVPAWDNGDEVVAADWWVIIPSHGQTLMVADENKWYVFGVTDDWQMLWDPSLSHRSVAREFSFYCPYLVRPGTTIFSYVATQETTIPDDAAGSGAFCEIAPTGAVLFPLLAGGTQVGQISFGAGSTDGAVTMFEEAVIVPTIEENMYQQARVFEIRSPADTFGMQGLNVTIAAKIRSID